ncbi:hypothetical protein CEP88_19700 [Roseobacter denitrificans]|nr:hypothetical protein CEP88_19700 [Roseobacter denitrificans]
MGRRMRPHLSMALPVALLLSACAQQVPNNPNGSGVTSAQAIEARDAALQGLPLEASGAGLAPLDATGAPIADSAEQTAADTTRILQQTSTTGTLQPVPPTVTNTIGISNENNFDAVSEQRSIESDAERIAQNRAQYQVIQPEALPERTGDDQPNIVAFALATSHPVGTRVYARAGLNGAARAARNCAQYPSPDRAQLDFLARGGPKRDRKGLDPDGDGYACSWDPTPFRSAAQG